MPDAITAAQLKAGRQALIDATLQPTRGEPLRATRVVTQAVFGIEATLFHLGVIDDPSTNAGRDKNGHPFSGIAAVDDT